MENEKQILQTEIFKILNFVHYEGEPEDEWLSDGELLDHVIDKLKALVQPEPYIDQWTRNQFIDKNFNKKEEN